MAKQGLSTERGKYAYMEGWGLAVLGWNRGGDNELGEGKVYLVLHKKTNKHSIWSSAIFGAPQNVTANITATAAALNATNATENDTDDANDTANATAPAAAPATPPPAAPAAPATPPAAGAAPANATNATNTSNKTNKSKNATKKALPTPYEGDDSDDDNAPKDLSFDINDEDEEADEDETIKE
jgi:hypothetical protein